MALSEQRIIDDVAAILEVDASTISRDTTLSDAGLDSLRMVMLVENWRAEGNEVDFQELISLPTLGQWIDALGAS
ncbi:MAG TPA: phosphopantetheine-binding protein [Dietzia timorensis]|jgi:aryl carrier-like protein|uniref:Phosphopantetheine-binding protein n=1 Tax=Dietzia timorensis TaxID=499555 RepID=A0A921F3F9_9ACTN|nr:phosphopantetheine-binding protein [Dietzia timorensis]HJE90555.1 phosphopantetheine-binding protein [Dietzia timorensis]